MPKSLKSNIGYKTFSPTSTAFIDAKGKALGDKAKLTTVFENKSSDMIDADIVRFIGTSESVDRDGEVIKLDAWDFTDYVNNPVVLFMHDSRAMPIGKTVGIYKDEVNRVIFFDIYLSKTYEAAKTIKALVEEGILKATSVGFRVLDWEYDEKIDAYVFTKTELFEISIVNVPANQDALLQEGKDVEIENTKSAEIDQLIATVSQMQSTVGTLVETVASLAKPQEEPKEEPKEEIPPIVEEPKDESVPQTVTIDEEALVARIMEAVLNTLKPNQEVPNPDETSPSDEVVEEKPTDENTEPETKPDGDEETLVSVADLDESEEFTIITQEEN